LYTCTRDGQRAPNRGRKQKTQDFGYPQATSTEALKSFVFENAAPIPEQIDLISAIKGTVQHAELEFYLFIY